MKHLRSALLFAFGLCVSLYYGRRGFMPLDQSIVFDGGWRILCGELPFRDYVAPNGFVVHAMQALFFSVAGVSWFAYALHAAVINGLFALTVDRILRLLGGPSALALAYAIASSLVLYPPIGVPYMETHAFFFSAVGLWLALEGRRIERESDGTTSFWPWLLLPTVMLLAGLSKQIPSAFVLPVVVAVAVWGDGFLRRSGLLAMGAGMGVAAIGIAAAVAELDPNLFVTYFFELPAAEAPRRLAGAGVGPGALWAGARSLGMGSLLTVQVALLAALVMRCGRGPLRLLLLAEGLLAASLLFGLATLNQPELAVAYVFLTAGIAHIGLIRMRNVDRAGVRLVATGLAALVAIVALRDAWDFHTRVNTTRIVNDIEWDPTIAARNAADLPPGLSFLQWQVPAVVPYGARDLRELADFLKREDRGFLLIGDASVLYGLTGKPSAAPSLWFHPGLATPTAGSPELRDYETWMLSRIASLDVRYLVLEGRETWNHLTIDDLPRVSRMAREATAPRRQFGGFRVVDLTGDRTEP